MNIWKTNNREGCRDGPGWAGAIILWTVDTGVIFRLHYAVFAMGFMLWSQLFLYLVSDYTGGGRDQELLSRITSAAPGVKMGGPHELYLHFSEYLSQKIVSSFKENAVKWGFNVTSRQRRSHGEGEGICQSENLWENLQGHYRNVYDVSLHHHTSHKSPQ